ncbi:MAG TPA: PDZ domain-containing protein [Planctomycetota bacterium]|nr:PDZ domain-containing protein [Planctomycetota bacterium]
MKRLMSIGSVAALILGQAAMLRAQDPPEPRSESVRAFSLRVTGDGHVEMTVQENGQDRTYKADSMDEFTRKYPDLARQFGVGRGGIRAWTSRPPEEFRKSFEEWRKQFGDFEFGKQDPELRKLLEHPEQLFQDQRAPKAAPPADGTAVVPGPRLGIRLAPLSQVLADQLGLDAQKGAQIVEIDAGSAAEKSGLRKNDVLLQVDGKEPTGVDGVRDSVREALKKKDFDIEILRHGQKQTVKVQSPARK